MHLDLDSFFASVEKALNPSYRDKPVAISAPRGQAMVTAATYDAKAMGIKIGMTRREAKKRCPDLIFVQSRMEAYSIVSEKVRNIIYKYFEEFETLGIDECFTEYRNLKERYKIKSESIERKYRVMEKIGIKIRDQVEREMKITLSVGIGSNKIIAKLATEDVKPNGVKVLSLDEELDFLYSRKIEDVMGVGGRTLEKLKPLGIREIGDIKNYSEKNLKLIAGTYQGRFLSSLVKNKPLKGVENNPYSKSMGATRSMRYFEKNAESVFEELLSELLERLHQQDRTCQIITVVKVGENGGYMKKKDLGKQSRDKRELTYYSRKLYKEIRDVGKVTFLGVTFHKLAWLRQLSIEEEELSREILETEPVYREIEKFNLTLKNGASYGLKVKHRKYGEGIILGLGEDGLRVRFRNFEKLFDLEEEQHIKIKEIRNYRTKK